MSPTMCTAIAIDLSRIRQQPVLSLTGRENVNPLVAARVRLLSTLQTSLDLETILDLFKLELDTLMRVTGFSYLNEPVSAINTSVSHYSLRRELFRGGLRIADAAGGVIPAASYKVKISGVFISYNCPFFTRLGIKTGP